MMAFWAIAQRVAESGWPSFDRLLVIISIVVTWGIGMVAFFWRVGLRPVKNDIAGISERIERNVKRLDNSDIWQEQINVRRQQSDLDRQRWDKELKDHEREIGGLTEKVDAFRDHIDNVKIDIMGAIKESSEKTDRQFGELKDRLKDVEVTVRERSTDRGKDG